VTEPFLTWPPKLGMKVHHDSKWLHTAWSGEVRAVIDKKCVVVVMDFPFNRKGEYVTFTKFRWVGGSINAGLLPNPDRWGKRP
jgi:hypothetical protein